MFFLSKESTRQMGDNVVLLQLDDGRVYLGNTQWCLLLPHSGLLPAHARDILAQAGDAPVDWRVIYASSITPDRFLPPYCRKFVPVMAEGYNVPTITAATAGLPRYDVLTRRDMHASMTEAYVAGKMTTVYDSEQERDTPVPLRDKELYYVYNDGEIYASISAPVFRHLHAAGVQVFVPSPEAIYDSEPPLDAPPPLVLLHPEHQVMGYLHPERDRNAKAHSGTTSADGRPLWVHASRACWAGEMLSWERLLSCLETYDPLRFDQDNPWKLRLENGQISWEMKVAVSSLRWHGISDADIVQEIEARAPEAYRENHRRLLENVAARVDDIQHRREPPADWWVKNMQRNARLYCTALETLSALLGEDLPMGDLPALVQLTDQLEGVA